MKRTKGILALTLVIAATLWMVAGCSPAASSAGGTTLVGNVQTTAQSNAATTTTKASPTKVSFFARFTDAPIDGNDPVINYLEKETNLDITFMANPASNYQERLQIMLASGKYPDLIAFFNHTDQLYIDAVENGVLVPLDDFLAKTPALVAAINPVSWNCMKNAKDNKIYGVPQPTAVRFDGFIVRKDWATKLGIEIPTDGVIDLELFKKLMKAFSTQDPDGNNLADTYGLTRSSGTNGELSVVLGQVFGLDGWQKYTGEDYPYMNLQWSKKSTAFKDALAFTNEMWKAGYIDKSWPSNKGNQIQQDRFKQGVAGMIGDFTGYVYDYETALKANYPQAACTYITGVKDKAGKVGGVMSGNGYWWLSAISTAAKGKEQAIINYLNFIVTDGWSVMNYGLEGTHYNVVNGDKVFTEAYTGYAKWKGVFKLVMPYKDLDYWLPNNLKAEQRANVKKWLGVCINQASLGIDQGYIPPASLEQTYIDYQSQVNQTISKIIVGELAASAWDECLDGWYKAGGQKYIEQMNEYIKTHSK